jgi:hypothetical protein
VEDGSYSMENYWRYSTQGAKKDGGTGKQCLILQNKGRKDGGDEGAGADLQTIKGLPF